MSKYKSYGKSKANARAGLHFDKLLKACSNSKKPPTAMAAGALGRFGVAEFTSTRGNNCLDSTGEDEMEKPSRFSSLKKRPRFEADLKSLGPLSLQPMPSALDPLFNSHMPVNSVPSQPTVFKPRKFFKSRGPIEVEADSNQARPLRPDVTHLVPPSIVNSNISNPILGSNQSNIKNSSHSSAYNSNSYHHHQDKKGVAVDNLKNTISPPTKNSKNSNSFSSVCSPPIKLRIIKDKATSKFVSVSDTTPSPVETDIRPQFPSHRLSHDSNSPTEKSSKKQKVKREKKDSKKIEKELKEKIPKPVKVKQLKPPKVQKPPKIEKPVVHQPPPVPRRSSGRVTRSSARHQDPDDSSQPDSGSTDSIPVSDGQENFSSSGRSDLSREILSSQSQPPSDDTIMRKLEEDAEFQKLSQMLSSMEEENGGSGSQSQAAGRVMGNRFSEDFGGTDSQQSQPFSQQSNNATSQQDPFPSNVSTASGNESDASYSSQSFNNLNPNPYFLHPAQAHNSTTSTRSDSNAASFGNNTNAVAQQTPVTMPDNKVQDIRSILEDDWNESFDDESPRKNPTSHHGVNLTNNQSPPKVSRFDASAFMSQQNQPCSPSVGEQVEEYNKRDLQENIQRPIPVYGNQIQNPQQQQQQQPFNINTSPYAMRNLLSCPDNGTKLSSGYDDEEEMSEEPQNLVCPKTELKMKGSVDDFASSQSQELSSQSQSQSLTSQGCISGSQSQNSNNSQASQQTTKKASIFKSRAAKNANSGINAIGGKGGDKKRLAVYKHTFGQQQDDQGAGGGVEKPAGTLYGDYDEFGDEEDGEESDLTLKKLRIANSSTGYSSRLVGEDDEGTKVLCKKEAKKLFTVVRNVKAGHELQESGESHEFDGDIWYILEDLKQQNPMNNRCLSAITLATRCMDQAFRMHLRAHGTVAEFCKELHDAPQHPVLALLAATVLFVLSQDRLNMDLDTESLKLILALTKADPGSQQEMNENSETIKNRQRVKDLCLEMKTRGHAKHLKLDKLTSSELALETLLYLTSKRAGEWVKHELRALGGLDSIVGEVESSFIWVKDEISDGIWSENVIERLRKVDRCLQVLQQVTFNHEDNQRYLMQVSTREVDGGKVKCTNASPLVFLEMFTFCKEQLGQLNVKLEAAVVVREILFSVLRLLVNLSHDYRGIVLGSEIMLGMDGFLELSLHSTFQMSSHFPDEKVFDLLMHSLCLLLNLVEYSKNNRARILQSTVRKNSSGKYIVGSPSDSLNDSDDSGVEEELPVLDALVNMFLCRERSAKKEEQHTDNILTTGNEGSPGSSGASSSKSQKDSTSQEQEGSSVQDTIDKLIQTAGKHMENSLIAAYISLLIGYLIMDDQASVEQVRNSMPERKFLPLMVVLKKLFNFMSITSSASGSIRGLKATAIALKFYAKCDPFSDSELKKIIPD